MRGRVLVRRELNRATLDRQLLLRRVRWGPVEVVEHLVGLQAQEPGDPYQALWTRIEGFDPYALSAALEQREVVRLSFQRSTLHLVSARDCLALRSVLDGPQLRTFRGAFARRMGDADLATVLERGRALLEEEPRAFHELGKLLAPHFPQSEPQALAQALRYHLALVQVPPRGLWRRGGQARHTTAQHWLGGELAEDRTPDTLVLRYLAAFGPASVKDAQLWSGLTRLREVFDRLRDRLVVFRSEDGAELYDLPEAPRPPADVVAPARLLPQFDNVFIGHADRTRVISRENLGRTSSGNQGWPVFLADGEIAGIWRPAVDHRRGRAAVTLNAFGRLPAGARAEVAEEAAAILALYAPDAAPDVRWSTDHPWA